MIKCYNIETIRKKASNKIYYIKTILSKEKNTRDNKYSTLMNHYLT